VDLHNFIHETNIEQKQYGQVKIMARKKEGDEKKFSRAGI
jgi:hypothetical protein